MDHLFEVPRTQTLDSHLRTAFELVRSARRTVRGRYEFVESRASAFPICPRAYHLSRRLPKKYRPKKTEKFLSESAALMGTALHLACQKWFGIVHPDNWYGNYRCPVCGKMKRHRYGLQWCKKCRVEMVYEEYRVEQQKGVPFSGHIDGIFRTKDENYLLDFKGAYEQKIKKVRMSGYPVESHYYQTNGYACAINKGKVDCGDLTKIDKIIVLYIDRGRPHIFWYPVQVVPSLKVFKKTKTLIKLGRKSVSRLELPTGLCSSLRDKSAEWCDWKSVCFNSNLSSLLLSNPYPELHFKPQGIPELDVKLRGS